MELKMRRYTALVVSSQPRFNDDTAKLLSLRQRIDMELEGSVSSARRRLSDRNFDFLIINSPLPDENGIRLAIDHSGSGTMAVLLIIPEKYYGEIFDRVCQNGVFTLSKPLSRQSMEQALDWLESANERLKKAKKKTVSLEEKMQEIRIVNRAKWLLISQQGMTEEQAHRLIEKTAMDRCMTKRAVAEEILEKS